MPKVPYSTCLCIPLWDVLLGDPVHGFKSQHRSYTLDVDPQDLKLEFLQADIGHNGL